ncbi:MAG: hypothetical protein Q9169_000759 [Polycauliona sp. 2 TL-2023]
MLLSIVYTTSSVGNTLLLESVGTGLVIYLIFYPRPPLPSNPPKRHSLSKSDLALSPERREIEASIPYPRLPRIIASISLILILIILVPPLVIIFAPHNNSESHRSLMQDWSTFTSTLSLLAATIQFVPQMYTTLRLKHHRSLSMVTLAVQIPVSLLLGINKASQSESVPHNDEGRQWWVRWLQDEEMVWMSHIVSGCAEALLLILCLYLYFSRRRFGRDDLDGDEEAEEEYITSVSMGEETPLLPGRSRTDLQTSQRFGKQEFMSR